MTVRGFAVSGLKDRADKTRKAWAYAFANSTTRIWDRALRNGTLENPSQREGFETKEKERETFCKILHSAKDLDVGIAICIVVYVI